MVALGSSVAPALPAAKVNAAPLTKSGQICIFAKPKLPEPVEDFGRACAKMIWATFPGRSQWDVCLQAAMHLGCDPKTIGRILDGSTKHPDPRLMFAVLPIYQAKFGKGFGIGGGLEIRIVVTGSQK